MGHRPALNPLPEKMRPVIRDWSGRTFLEAHDNDHGHDFVETPRDVEDALIEKIQADIGCLLGLPVAPYLFVAAYEGTDAGQERRQQNRPLALRDIYILTASLVCAKDAADFRKVIAQSSESDVRAIVKSIAPQFSAYAALCAWAGGMPDVDACNVILYDKHRAAYFIDLAHTRPLRDFIPNNSKANPYPNIVEYYLSDVFGTFAPIGEWQDYGFRKAKKYAQSAFCPESYERARDLIGALSNETISSVVSRVFADLRAHMSARGLNGSLLTKSYEARIKGLLIKRRNRMHLLHDPLIGADVYPGPQNQHGPLKPAPRQRRKTAKPRLPKGPG